MQECLFILHSRQFRVDYSVNLYAPSKRGKPPAGAEAAKETGIPDFVSPKIFFTKGDFQNQR
jgi:hypothetical protein